MMSHVWKGEDLIEGRATNWAPDEEKFKELLLYVADKSADDPNFGATKLNKILFFCDLFAYAALGSPITGVEYQKLEYGPAPRRLRPLQRALEDSGAVKVTPVSRSSFVQRRLVALREPKLELFSGPEIALIDNVIAALRTDTATSVSDFSHRWMPAWDSVRLYETIPYSIAYWGPPNLSDEDASLAAITAKELGMAG